MPLQWSARASTLLAGGVEAGWLCEDAGAVELSFGKLQVRDAPEVVVRGPRGVAACGRSLYGTDEDLGSLILASYAQWGTALLHHLEAECAFVLWDAEADEILLGRDTTGAWPLYANAAAGRLQFASSVGELAQAGVPMRLSEPQVAEWLSLYAFERQRTFFDGVLNLTPGSLYRWKGKDLECCSEWRPDRLPWIRYTRRGDYQDHLRELLRAAVAARLPRAGTAVTTLSGGLDSTTISALSAEVCEERGVQLHAFTAVPRDFDPKEYPFADEREHAIAVAQMYPKVDHRFVDTRLDDMFQVIDLLNGAQGEPVVNPSSMAWLMEVARQTKALGTNEFLVGSMGNVTISRSGTKAVEGYVKEGELLRALSVGYKLVREGALPIGNAVRQMLAPLPGAQKLSRFRTAGKSLPVLSFINVGFARKHGVAPEQVRNAWRTTRHRELLLRRYRYSDAGMVAGAMRQVGGVGFTDPAADRRVVEYCWSVPEDEFCAGGTPRALLRETMRSRLPAIVINERRRGMQGADVIGFMRPRREALLEKVRAMRDIDLLRHAVDLEQIERILSSDSCDQLRSIAFWSKLLRVLALGRFVESYAAGTLFG